MLIYAGGGLETKEKCLHLIALVISIVIQYFRIVRRTALPGKLIYHRQGIL